MSDINNTERIPYNENPNFASILADKTSGYTGIRLRAVVKPEYVEMVESICCGYDWSDFSDENEFLERFSKLRRADMIPHAPVSYMPVSWTSAKPPFYPTYGFGTKIELDTGEWTFQCSLKDSEDEIAVFLSDVLPHIIESSSHLEVINEYWNTSIMYDLVDGELVLNGKSIVYPE